MMKFGKRLLPILLTLSMGLSLLPTAALAAEADSGEKHLTILGTSDMHGNIWGFSYEDSSETTNNGMARLYTYIQQVRTEDPNTILIDAGDDIQGTIMTDDLYNKTPEEPHPIITAMNYMGYDAMTLGNHEFNWGIPTMQTILSQAEFPVLAANVTDAAGELVTGAGWTIVERDGIRVAIIGVVTPDVPIWDGGKEGIDDAVYEAANVAVGQAIDEIGDQADVIVVSAHTCTPSSTRRAAPTPPRRSWTTTRRSTCSRWPTTMSPSAKSRGTPSSAASATAAGRSPALT